MASTEDTDNGYSIVRELTKKMHGQQYEIRTDDRIIGAQENAVARAEKKLESTTAELEREVKEAKDTLQEYTEARKEHQADLHKTVIETDNALDQFKSNIAECTFYFYFLVSIFIISTGFSLVEFVLL